MGALIETIQKTVSKGKKVTLVGFGTFESRKRAARIGRNPQTGKELKIPATTVPAFSAGKKFKTLHLGCLLFVIFCICNLKNQRPFKNIQYLGWSGYAPSQQRKFL